MGCTFKTYFMSPRFLLSPRMKYAGLVIAIPAFALMVAYLNFDFTLEFLDYSRPSEHFSFNEGFLFNLHQNNFTDELGGVLLTCGLLLMAFSREKDEDERIMQLRLESLLWAVLNNSLFIMVSIILFYNELFLTIMAYNICTTLILFVIRFNLVLYLVRRKSLQS